jgi:hypothetical protein
MEQEFQVYSITMKDKHIEFVNSLTEALVYFKKHMGRIERIEKTDLSTFSLEGRAVSLREKITAVLSMLSSAAEAIRPARELDAASVLLCEVEDEVKFLVVASAALRDCVMPDEKPETGSLFRFQPN